MTPTFAITIEPQRCLMRITLSGFFDLRDVLALDNEKRTALVRLGCAQNQHFTLVDVSGCKLQAQDVFGAFQGAINDPRFMAKRIAFVTGSSLARIQVRRMISRNSAAFFETVEEAEAWLFQEDLQQEPQAAA